MAVMNMPKTRMTSKQRRQLGRYMAYVILGVMALIILIPMTWILMASFKPNSAFVGPPVFVFEPTTEHYRAMLRDGSFLLYATNSIIVTIVSTVVSVVLAALGAYGLARIRPPGHQGLGLAIVTMRMLPPIALVVPLFMVAIRLGVQDTRLALILPYIALSIPLATWMLQGFFMDLPRELEEAAWIDGCSRIGAFFRVILPLALPGIAAVSVFSFVLAWNDLVVALTLTQFDAVTLPVFASRARTEEGINWGGLGALTTLIMIPAVAFTIVMRRFIVGGLAGSAVKG